MIAFTPISSIVGGALIGAAALMLLKFNGRIAGISGIVNGAFSMTPGDRVWRVLFLVGLVVGGYLYQIATQQPLLTREGFPISQLIVAGLLVGAGTRLGSGCTSGHGVCGIARLSLRSIVATLAFLAAGMATATVTYLIFGRP